MSRFERWAIWVTTAGTLVTGLVYWWMKDFLEPVDPWAVINHPLQPWVLKAHILIAPFLVFSVGLITSKHIWRHYRLAVQKGRRSGLLAAGTFGLMVLSGYLIQVFTAEAVLAFLGWLHLGLGVVYSAGVAFHRPAKPRRGTVEGPGPRDVARGAPGGRARSAGSDPDRGTDPDVPSDRAVARRRERNTGARHRRAPGQRRPAVGPEASPRRRP